MVWETVQPTTNATTLIGSFHPFIGHKGPYGEYRYSSTLFLTSALEGGEGSASRPGRTLPPGKTRYPLYRWLGGPQGRSGQVRKISPPPGFDSRTVQPVGSSTTLIVMLYFTFVQKMTSDYRENHLGSRDQNKFDQNKFCSKEQ
jgi:hypothetical protein